MLLLFLILSNIGHFLGLQLELMITPWKRVCISHPLVTKSSFILSVAVQSALTNCLLWLKSRHSLKELRRPCRTLLVVTAHSSLMNSALTNVFVPIDHHPQPSKPLPLNQLTKNRTNEPAIAEPCVPFSVRVSSRPTEHRLPLDLEHSPCSCFPPEFLLSFLQYTPFNSVNSADASASLN